MPQPAPFNIPVYSEGKPASFGTQSFQSVAPTVFPLWAGTHSSLRAQDPALYLFPDPFESWFCPHQDLTCEPPPCLLQPVLIHLILSWHHRWGGLPCSTLFHCAFLALGQAQTDLSISFIHYLMACLPGQGSHLTFLNDIYVCECVRVCVYSCAHTWNVEVRGQLARDWFSLLTMCILGNQTTVISLGIMIESS